MENYNLEDSIFDFVYRMAVNDATMQRAYCGSKSDIENNRELKEIVRNYINGILQTDEKRISFEETADAMVRCVGKDSEFTFGNIQKLINMTAKYMYISCYCNEKNRKNFISCHCPMDVEIVKKVRREYKELCKDEKCDKTLLDIPCGAGKSSRDGSLIAWSKIKSEYTEDSNSRIVYDRFQEMVKEICKFKNYKPLEYDYVNWKRNS